MGAPSGFPVAESQIFTFPFHLTQVDEVFNLTKIGSVLAGTLSHGIMREGDKLLIGPTDCGEFVSVTVASLHRNRTPCRVIRPGQTASVAVTDVDRSILRRVSCFF